MRILGLFEMARFGKMPAGERLLKIKQSSNFKDGAFQNQSVTPNFTGGATYTKVLKQVLFGRPKRSKPTDKILSVKTDLLALQPNENCLVWFGHSSISCKWMEKDSLWIRSSVVQLHHLLS